MANKIFAFLKAKYTKIKSPIVKSIELAAVATIAAPAPAPAPAPATTPATTPVVSSNLCLTKEQHQRSNADKAKRKEKEKEYKNDNDNVNNDIACNNVNDDIVVENDDDDDDISIDWNQSFTTTVCCNCANCKQFRQSFTYCCVQSFDDTTISTSTTLTTAANTDNKELVEIETPVSSISISISISICSDRSPLEAAAELNENENETNMSSSIRRRNDNGYKNGYHKNGTIMTGISEKREHLYKILVIGELGTGKTSFIKRYVHQFFSQNYRATIGVDFALKVINWDANTVVRLQLWDIAGQERFGNMTRVYYKDAVGAFIVFDVTRSSTFDCVAKWKDDLDSKVQLADGSPIPCILLANKCDQDKQGAITNPEKLDEYARDNCFAGWFSTSAKENINIDEAARALVSKILHNDKLISAGDLADAERLNLSDSSDKLADGKKSKCAC